MFGQDGVDDLRDDGIAVTDDAGEEVLITFKASNDVFAEFVLNGKRLVAAGFELAHGAGLGGGMKMGHVVGLSGSRDVGNGSAEGSGRQSAG